MATVEQKRNAVVPIGDKVQLWFVICNAWSFISWAGSGQQNPLDYSVAIQLFRNRTLVHGISQHFENEDWAVCFSWNPFGSPCHQTKPCWKIRELAIGAKCNSCHDTDPWRAGEGFLINRLYIYKNKSSWHDVVVWRLILHWVCKITCRTSSVCQVSLMSNSAQQFPPTQFASQ